eukprot:TRINITY_DN34613_c0_g1_i1.p1 TRINITY_DN34613_c0_g1~~TRINITY_DN34613_c0_g1_i1.p1  ORF type:complete len:256 (-),score=30.76 TRINITY_DN34613_c0_g1_i1:68-835(-)
MCIRDSCKLVLLQLLFAGAFAGCITVTVLEIQHSPDVDVTGNDRTVVTVMLAVASGTTVGFLIACVFLVKLYQRRAKNRGLFQPHHIIAAWALEPAVWETYLALTQGPDATFTRAGIEPCCCWRRSEYQVLRLVQSPVVAISTKGIYCPSYGPVAHSDKHLFGNWEVVDCGEIVAVVSAYDRLCKVRGKWRRTETGQWVLPFPRGFSRAQCDEIAQELNAVAGVELEQHTSDTQEDAIPFSPTGRSAAANDVDGH